MLALFLFVCWMVLLRQPGPILPFVMLGLALAYFPLFGVNSMARAIGRRAGIGKSWWALALLAPVFLVLSALVVRLLHFAAGSPVVQNVVLYHLSILVVAWSMLAAASAMFLQRLQGERQPASVEPVRAPPSGAGQLLRQRMQR